MPELLDQEEKRIVDLLKKYTQLKYEDLKIFMGYEEDGEMFLRMLQKLGQKGYVVSLSALGAMYWRNAVPLTIISSTAYRKAQKIVDSYVKQLEGNQKEKPNETIAEVKKPISIRFMHLPKTTYGEHTFYDFTNNPRILRALESYYVAYHQFVCCISSV